MKVSIELRFIHIGDEAAFVRAIIVGEDGNEVLTDNGQPLLVVDQLFFSGDTLTLDNFHYRGGPDDRD